MRAPGKINVFLEVGDVADNGYHEVATAYQAVSLYEEITATPADDITIQVAGTSTVDAHRERHAVDIGPTPRVPAVDPDVLHAIRQGDARMLAASVRNDLQAPALHLRPDLARVLERGERSGALAGLVSGPCGLTAPHHSPGRHTGQSCVWCRGPWLASIRVVTHRRAPCPRAATKGEVP